MTVLIGLTGNKGSGKDTAYQFIRNWAADRGARSGRAGFADALKLSFSRIFIPDCSMDEAIQWCDTLKESSELVIQWDRFSADQTLTTVSHQITGRQALQRFGTEGHRQVFGDTFWIDVLLPKTASFDFKDGPQERPSPTWESNFISRMDELQNPFSMEPPEICVVTDVRFANEAERIKEFNGQIWEIYRSGRESDDTHASEQGVPTEMIDKTIYNSVEGDLSYLESHIRSEMTSEYHMHFQEEEVPEL
jgi:hypothetical protein